jgi:hypothetical protein
MSRGGDSTFEADSKRRVGVIDFSAKPEQQHRPKLIANSEQEHRRQIGNFESSCAQSSYAKHDEDKIHKD